MEVPTDNKQQKLLENVAEWILAKLNLRIVLLSLVIVLLFIAWNRGIALIYSIFSIVTATFLVTLVIARFNLRGITIKRKLPQTAQEGKDITLGYELSTSRHIGNRMLEVIDKLPFALQIKQQAMTFIPMLKGSTTLSLTIGCNRRGRHQLGPITLQSSYPLGINQISETVYDTWAEILVYPGTFPIRNLVLLGAGHLLPTGVSSASKEGGHDIFIGLRDYRHGDSIRHIHWNASARHGKLVVKENENINKTEVCIVLDLNQKSDIGEGIHSTLEYAVKIAASIARFAIENGHIVSLICNGKSIMTIKPDSGPAQLDAILNLLAVVKADGDNDYQLLVNKLTRDNTGNKVLMLFDHSKPQDPISLTQLRRHQQLVMVRFDTDSFLNPVKRSNVLCGTSDFYLVCCHDDLKTIFSR